MVVAQPLAPSHGDHRKFAETVEAAGRNRPDTSFTIFIKILNGVSGETIGLTERVRRTVMNVNETAAFSCQPQASIAIAEHCRKRSTGAAKIADSVLVPDPGR